MTVVVDKLNQMADVKADKKFSVVEVFGPTIQGEGPLAGAVSHFVRFGGCDYRCTWCDTAPAVLPENVRLAPKLTTSEIIDQVRALPPAEWVTLSGGNPALLNLNDLVTGLKASGFKISIETQGSVWKEWIQRLDNITISPKPPSSLMAGFTDHRKVRETLDDLAKQQPFLHQFSLKVPIYDRADFEWATRLHQDFPEFKFFLSIVTRMGGLLGDFAGGVIDTNQDILNRYHEVIDWTLAEPAMKDVRVIPQLHALVWGHERGH